MPKTKKPAAKKPQAKNAAPAVKRGRGRPTDYLPSHCEKVVKLGKMGKSKAQIAAALDVCRQTLDEWALIYPDFSNALTRARDFSLAWWEDKGQNSLETPGFQSSLWAKSVSARFPAEYTERSKTELTGGDGGPVQTVNVFKLADLE